MPKKKKKPLNRRHRSLARVIAARRLSRAVTSSSERVKMADPSAKQTGQKSVKIAAGAVVCVESDIRGDVTIGARTVVHPKARIIAEAGPIVIGEGNLIEEQALIINRSALYYSRRSSRDGPQLPNTNEHILNRFGNRK
ncbi:dynactin subunit 6-like [Sinocyclocheilus grahami]|uniref:dynactin subunit 6-like n=1 Tax=Sinocyclocheilus grahami TaxID=75366 RepID=UPI0007AC624D|nr:PREDICTED: dynactin subunit 6-like [Sinocyclocheilus grahami]